jgi:hypothetical protein
LLIGVMLSTALLVGLIFILCHVDKVFISGDQCPMIGSVIFRIYRSTDRAPFRNR